MSGTRMDMSCVSGAASLRLESRVQILTRAVGLLLVFYPEHRVIRFPFPVSRFPVSPFQALQT